MPLLFVDRNGHPEAMMCPMLICDVCGHPIQAGQNGFAARWRSLGSVPLCSPTYFVHSNPAQRCLDELERHYGSGYEDRFEGAVVLTSNLDEVVEQVAVNFRSPVGGPGDVADAAHGGGNVEYVAPVLADAGPPPGARISWSAVVYGDGEVRARTRRV